MNPHRAQHIGLTGSIGAGKTTVSRLLRQHGAVVLDADAVARSITAQPAVIEEIVAAFGPEVRGEDGQLLRPALAKLVFGDETARATLNAIVHPRVRAEMAAQQAVASAAGARVVVQDIPLLFENQLESLFDLVVVVDAPQAVRQARVMARDASSEAGFLARDAAQLPADEKRRRAQVVLENDGDVKKLEMQVERLMKRLLGPETSQ
jgi:dephospho-CoA kinase